MAPKDQQEKCVLLKMFLLSLFAKMAVVVVDYLKSSHI